jgi:hypothetical protein
VGLLLALLGGGEGLGGALVQVEPGGHLQVGLVGLEPAQHQPVDQQLLQRRGLGLAQLGPLVG